MYETKKTKNKTKKKTEEEDRASVRDHNISVFMVVVKQVNAGVVVQGREGGRPATPSTSPPLRTRRDCEGPEGVLFLSLVVCMAGGVQ